MEDPTLAEVPFLALAKKDCLDNQHRRPRNASNWFTPQAEAKEDLAMQGSEKNKNNNNMQRTKIPHETNKSDVFNIANLPLCKATDNHKIAEEAK